MVVELSFLKGRYFRVGRYFRLGGGGGGALLSNGPLLSEFSRRIKKLTLLLGGRNGGAIIFGVQ